jgi:AcrR family transcriptional regulator
MPSGRIRLTRDDWITAGLVALAEGGPDAVAIEPLAVRLGATKGSGYWHWGARAALLEAVLEAWRRTTTDDIVAAVEGGGGSARQRLTRLLAIVTTALEQYPGHLLTLAHPAARTAVKQATRTRIAYLEQLLCEAGIQPTEARGRALVLYAAYLGIGHLSGTAPDVLPESRPERQALLERVVNDALHIPETTT